MIIIQKYHVTMRAIFVLSTNSPIPFEMFIAYNIVHQTTVTKIRDK